MNVGAEAIVGKLNALGFIALLLFTITMICLLFVIEALHQIVDRLGKLVAKKGEKDALGTEP